MNITAPIEISSFLLQVNQQVIDRYDSLIGTISMIAAVFGVIIAVVFFFATVKYITVNREIKRYKKEIQSERETAKKIRADLQATFAKSEKWLDDEKGKIEKEVEKISNIPKEKLETLERLEKRLDGLKEGIAFQEGAISASPLDFVGTRTNQRAGFYGSFSDRVTPFSATHTCKKCGALYKDTSEPITDIYSVLPSRHHRCPVCSHVNNENDFHF